MKVLFKSFYLYLLGVAADVIRWVLEYEVKRSQTTGRTLSAKKLAFLSDLSYRFYSHFLRIEADLQNVVKFL